MKSVLFYNTTAGNAPQLDEAVKELSREPTCRVIPFDHNSDQDHVIAMAWQWQARRWVVAGGDGTLHRLVSAVGERLHEIELGIVPCGTGNDFARSLEARLDDLLPLCLDSEFGSLHKVDLIRLTDESNGDSIRFLNAATGGIGGEMASRIQSADKRTWGPFTYWMSAIRALAGMHGYELTLTVQEDEDSEPESFLIDAFGLVVSNGRFIGGGFPIAPSATLDDRHFDLTIVPTLPALELLSAGIAAATGNIEHSSAIVRRRLSRCHVSANQVLPLSVDGELQAAEVWDFRIDPAALTLVIPHDAPGLSDISTRLDEPVAPMPTDFD